MDEKKLVLHYSPLSQPSRAVHWFLLINNIPFEIKQRSFPELRTPEFMAMNPHHTLPTIQDVDGTCVFESNAIMFYLREKYSDKANLYPVTGNLLQRTRVQQVLSWYPSNLRQPCVNYIFPVIVGPKMFGMQPPPEEIKRSAMQKLRLGFVAQTDSPTVADLQLLSEIEQLQFVPDFDFSPFPNVQRFRSLMNSVPHHAAVFAPLKAVVSPLRLSHS